MENSQRINSKLRKKYCDEGASGNTRQYRLWCTGGQGRDMASGFKPSCSIYFVSKVI